MTSAYTGDTGIMPGDDKAWQDDLWGNHPTMFLEWNEGFTDSQHPEVQSAIHESIAQFHRLFPGTTSDQRKFMVTGLVLAHAWFYHNLTITCNTLFQGQIPPIFEVIFNLQEAQMIRLVTLLSRMTDEVDVSELEELFNE